MLRVRSLRRIFTSTMKLTVRRLPLLTLFGLVKVLPFLLSLIRRFPIILRFLLVCRQPILKLFTILLPVTLFLAENRPSKSQLKLNSFLRASFRP